jgi:hypothetical protein
MKENQPQPGRAPVQPQTDRTRGPQEQQQPGVKYAPPARVNPDTYNPHQFEKPRNVEKPQNAPPAKASSEQPKTQDRGEQRGQESKKPDAGDQEQKQR